MTSNHRTGTHVSRSSCHHYNSLDSNVPLFSGSIRQQLEYRDEHTGGTALYWMCVSGNYDIVSRLLNLGADVNTLNYIQHTALHAAADLGYTHIARLLLKQ